MRELWGTLLCWKMLLTCGKRNEEGTKLFWKHMFVGDEHLRTWCWLVKCFISIVMGMKPPWKGISTEWRYLCSSVVYFGGFPVILTSSPSPTSLSVHWKSLCFSKIKPLGPQLFSNVGSSWCKGNLLRILCCCLKEHYLQLNIKILVSVWEFVLAVLNYIFSLNYKHVLHWV